VIFLEALLSVSLINIEETETSQHIMTPAFYFSSDTIERVKVKSDWQQA